MNKTAIAVLSCWVATMTAVAAPTTAQETEGDLRQEIEALKKGQRKIQRDVDKILKILSPPARARAGAKVRDVIFDLRDNPIEGVSTAKLTLLEFTDYQ